MYVYIWQCVDECSSNYHSSGGVVVVAASEARAREIANAVDGCSIQPDESPDQIIACANTEQEVVYIMPDAGCC